MLTKEKQNKWQKKPCMSLEHNPPTMLYIPPGETFTHICPSCGNKVVMHGSNITF